MTFVCFVQTSGYALFKRPGIKPLRLKDETAFIATFGFFKICTVGQ